MSMVEGAVVNAKVPAEAADIFSGEALAFVAELQRTFNSTRQQLLARRQERSAAVQAGAALDFLPETAHVRNGGWRVVEAAPGLVDRRVEITGPADRKMMINALNSGAQVFMADLEDALSPTWANVTAAQVNLRDAVSGSMTFVQADGKRYQLNEQVATLVVRPRGWHLHEKHVTVDGEPVSASLFDFGMTFFHNARRQLERGLGPYFYLPKLESHLEARLWNDVFAWAQERLGIPHGSVRATVLIETIWAAFEMDEILYELRDHAAGLNAGRWDYIFSLIKTMRESADHVLPDRAQVTMAVPFMRAYTELLVKSCHKRGAHAIGGMAAFIPTRSDPAVNELAFARVKEDKEREARAGFDGTWIAHPGLAEVARAEFDRVLDGRPNQKERQRDEVQVTATDLLTTRIDGGEITDAGLRTNVSVAIQYIDNWLRGNGAAAINNLMEDAATAEISRAQLWQWIRHGAMTSDGEPVTRERYAAVRDEELAKLGGAGKGRQGEAAELLDGLVLSDDFTPFLTIPAYALLD
jgi:malate synthase